LGLDSWNDLNLIPTIFKVDVGYNKYKLSYITNITNISYHRLYNKVINRGRAIA